MDRVQKIMEHRDFLLYLENIKKEERERRFCGHGLEHLLDVARIAYIFVLESGSSIKKDVVYGTALLHDIGKIEQYRRGIPHEKAGVELARPILVDCGYEEELPIMLGAIANHRFGREDEQCLLYESIHKADKWSRACMWCEAREQCNWKEKTKNKILVY